MYIFGSFVSFNWNWNRVFGGNKRDSLVGGIAREKRNREMAVASSLCENEGESVSRIAIRLKILSGPRDAFAPGLVGASGKKVFP